MLYPSKKKIEFFGGQAAGMYTNLVVEEPIKGNDWLIHMYSTQPNPTQPN